MVLQIGLLTIQSLLCTCIFRTDETSIKEIITKADLIIYVKTVPDNDATIFNDSTIFVEQINFEIKDILKGEALLVVPGLPFRYSKIKKKGRSSFIFVNKKLISLIFETIEFYEIHR